MAEEDLEKNQESGEGSDVKKGSKGGLLKFILIPVILLGQAVGAYYLVFNVLIEHPNKQESPKANNLQVGQFFELNDIVINPAGSAGRRYIVLELGLETTEPKLIEEAKSKEIWIRDAILTLLTNKKEEELLDLSKRSLLKKQILNIMNSKMAEGKFSRVYFKKYIMQ